MYFISKSLSVLKDKGFVCQEDKKYKAKYFITDEGKKVFDEVSLIINDVVEKAGYNLTDEERDLFYITLKKIISNLARYHEERENA